MNITLSSVLTDQRPRMTYWWGHGVVEVGGEVLERE